MGECPNIFPKDWKLYDERPRYTIVPSGIRLQPSGGPQRSEVSLWKVLSPFVDMLKGKISGYAAVPTCAGDLFPRVALFPFCVGTLLVKIMQNFMVVRRELKSSLQEATIRLVIMDQ